MTIWTIGHSTRSAAEFIELLQREQVEVLVDVRRFPGSRKYPHFSGDALKASLPVAGIDYIQLPALGGRRAARPDSPNTAWRNDAFRGYADYMETAEFLVGFRELTAIAQIRRTAIMCAEAVWWRCHRGLVADLLKVEGWEVLHIFDKKVERHPFTGAARVVDGKLTYAAEEAQPSLL